MTDMFFPAVLVCAAISLVLGILTQYDNCCSLVHRLAARFSHLRRHHHSPRA
jgi:hypothetical protein